MTDQWRVLALCKVQSHFGRGRGLEDLLRLAETQPSSGELGAEVDRKR